MAKAIDSGDVEAVKTVLAEYPEQLDYRGGGSGSWLHRACETDNIALVDALIDGGFDVNVDSEGGPEILPPLSRAVSHGQLEVARHLISRGADVNLGRELIGAINVSSDFDQDAPEREVTAFELVKLLVESGADVNRWWYFGDPKNAIVHNALSWATVNEREDIADYLRDHGAVMPPKVKRPTFWVRAWRRVFGDKPEN
jgi:ankyrin repeat protein